MSELNTCTAKGLPYVHVERFDGETIDALIDIYNSVIVINKTLDGGKRCSPQHRAHRPSVGYGQYVVKLPIQDNEIHVCDADEFAEKYQVDVDAPKQDAPKKVLYEGKIYTVLDSNDDFDGNPVWISIKYGSEVSASDCTPVPDDAEMVCGKLVRGTYEVDIEDCVFAADDECNGTDCAHYNLCVGKGAFQAIDLDAENGGEG